MPPNSRDRTTSSRHDPIGRRTSPRSRIYPKRIVELPAFEQLDEESQRTILAAYQPPAEDDASPISLSVPIIKDTGPMVRRYLHNLELDAAWGVLTIYNHKPAQPNRKTRRQTEREGKEARDKLNEERKRKDEDKRKELEKNAAEDSTPEDLEEEGDEEESHVFNLEDYAVTLTNKGILIKRKAD